MEKWGTAHGFNVFILHFKLEYISVSVAMIMIGLRGVWSTLDTSSKIRLTISISSFWFL
jgi:hypothetical protein